MQFDRQITITTGASRNDLNWKPQLMTVAELYDRLRNLVRSTETLDAYMHLPKPQQDALKDVGGFVGGSLNGGRRKANAVTGRDLVTLDFDNIPGWGTDEIISRVDAIGCSYAVYSTRKHCPNKPRLRVVIPLDRTATPDEYEPLARRLAWLIGIHAATHAFNEVQDFLKGLAWDGVPRLDTLFIDYLGADDSPYTRAVTRKAFVGAVARAMEPGCKFDNMLILCGPQGLGKSTLLDRMSKGWYNDSIRTFEGKEASELLQGVWLVEVAELDAFRRTDVSRIKQFLSLRYDRYRAAYGRNVKELPRCCVFFGTCNVSDFLQDTTGNRRFWPVDVGQCELAHRAWDLTDDEINQIWAEAKMRWMMGEPLFLTGDLADAARARQEDHREASVREGLIRDFVERDVPTNWLEWPLDKRRDYWAGACKGQDIPTMPRDRICAAEVWCELFNGAPRDIKQTDTREINAVLASTPGWEANRGMKFGPYKQQRGYRRFNRQT